MTTAVYIYSYCWILTEESLNALLSRLSSKKNRHMKLIETMHSFKVRRLQSIVEGKIMNFIKKFEHTCVRMYFITTQLKLFFDPKIWNRLKLILSVWWFWYLKYSGVPRKTLSAQRLQRKQHFENRFNCLYEPGSKKTRRKFTW